MKTKLTSKYEIGERVSIQMQGARLIGHIRAIIFTSSKVRYSIRVIGPDTTLHNIDSVFVLPVPKNEQEVLAMPEDNYS